MSTSIVIMCFQLNTLTELQTKLSTIYFKRLIMNNYIESRYICILYKYIIVNELRKNEKISIFLIMFKLEVHMFEHIRKDFIYRYLYLYT